MGLQKKHFIVGGIALISLSAAFLYWQFTKLKQGAIKLANVKIKDINLNKIDFELILLFTNQSKIKIEIISHDFKVYLNNAFITSVSNNKAIVIDKLATSPITLNVNINAANIIESLKNNYQDILLNPAKITVKVDVNVKIKLFGLTFSVPYTYNTNLKELTTKKPK